MFFIKFNYQSQNKKKDKEKKLNSRSNKQLQINHFKVKLTNEKNSRKLEAGCVLKSQFISRQLILTAITQTQRADREPRTARLFAITPAW